MCKFSHLTIGQEVGFTADDCNYCGAHLSLDTVAIYAGHVVDGAVYDVFKITPIRCPSCRNLLTTAFFECDSGPEIEIDFRSFVEAAYEQD